MNKRSHDHDIEPSVTVTLPLEWVVPESIQSRYATSLLVQSGPAEIVISFFEQLLPLLTGTPEENAAKLEAMGKIQTVCVGRIIVSPEHMEGMIAAMQTGFENYKATKAAVKKEE